MIPNFEWDLAKARENARKHGVTFEEAATVFADDDALIKDDIEHSVEEDRSITYTRSATKTRFGSSAAATLSGTRDKPMTRKSATPDPDPLDREIDFTDARRNPYARDYYKSRNLRVLAPDLLDVFPDSESVNEALRTLVRLTTSMPRKVSASTATAPKSPRKKAAS